MSDDLDKSWPRTVTLKHPIDMDGERLTSLVFQRGTMRALKGVKLGEEVATNDVMLIASRLCGQPLGVIERIDADDAGEVMDIALDFFKRCLAGGRTR